MPKKITIEVSDEVHEALIGKQEEKRRAIKAKVPIAIIVAEVLEETLIRTKK
ncbi:MAG TPA: hypothetical protein VD794_10945 [Flavisolibacter sp.]|nr:hypothetical protein [Flavisolibacter sp.]